MRHWKRDPNDSGEGRLIRAGFTLLMALRQRRALAALVLAGGLVPQVVQISAEALQNQGVLVLVVDFDGVLAPHGEYQPLPDAISWLGTCAKVLGEDRVFILTNKPTSARQNFFRTRFPTMRLVGGVRKKPYPDGLLHIIRTTGVAPQSVLLVDDRLLTGGLAACLAGTRMICIARPYVCRAKRPVQEGFFVLLRRLEKLYLGAIGASLEPNGEEVLPWN